MEIVKKIWAIIKNEKWEILIFKEKLEWKKFLFNIVKWTFNEIKDETLLNSLKREIFEETNIKNFVLEDIFDIFSKIYDNKNSILLVFICSINMKNEDISNKNIEKGENIKDYTWISKKDFEKLEKLDFIDDRIYNIIEKYYGL